jgi:hypothetical protein
MAGRALRIRRAQCLGRDAKPVARPAQCRAWDCGAAVNLFTRLDRLERAGGDGRVIVMWRRADEENAAAYARWCADHPDQPAPGLDDTNVIIVKWADPGDGLSQ